MTAHARTHALRFLGHIKLMLEVVPMALGEGVGPAYIRGYKRLSHYNKLASFT